MPVAKFHPGPVAKAGLKDLVESESAPFALLCPLRPLPVSEAPKQSSLPEQFTLISPSVTLWNRQVPGSPEEESQAG